MRKNLQKVMLLVSLFITANVMAENTDILTQNANTNQRVNVYVNNISVAGNRNVDLSEIIKQSNIKRGDLFDPEKIKELMNKIIETGYFQTITPDVKTNLENKSVDIVLNVKENPVLNSVTLKGVTVFDVEELKKSLGLEKGRLFNYYFVDPQRSPILEAYFKAGVIAPFIASSNLDENNNLVIEISEGTLTKINYLKSTVREDNVRFLESDFKLKTQPFVFERNENIKLGNILTLDGVTQLKNNLARTGLFDVIDPRLEIDPTNTKNRILNIVVDERRTASINAQLSYSKQSGLVGEVGISDKNFLGTQQDVGLSASFSTGGSYQFALNYYNPWIKNTDQVQAGASLFLKREKSTKKDLERDEKIDGNILYSPFANLIRPANEYTFGLDFSIGKRVYKDIYLSAKPKLYYNTAKTKHGLKIGESVLLGTGLVFNYDTRDDVFLPKNGINVVATFEANGILKDNHLTPFGLSKAYEDLKKEQDNSGLTPHIKDKKLTPEGKVLAEEKALAHKKDFEQKIDGYRKNSGLGKKTVFRPRFYGSFNLDALFYKSIIKDKNSFAFKYNLGLATNSTPSNSLFVTDNYGKTLRGYNESARTNFITSVTAENRFYINKYLQAVFFADAGIYAEQKTGADKFDNNGYQKYETIGEVFKGFKSHIRSDVGAGIRINTPLGLIRLDYGVPLINKGEQKGGKITFGFGHTF
ncbi:BamA/TamA family outer membrane protein [Oceanivirga salmonicida]|uniref:BamA/TamA family outer membrane protein n=1 Tax=Oceanivirga salmonicida TaxID=1769291 RepID=UPI0012E1827C|nr:BamA/TamA family outer membrane protein [Oceanivirga salmonicida]